MKRMWSLFEKQEDGTWRRITTMAYPKQQAVRVFQDALLAPYMGKDCGVRELRPVPKPKTDFEP